MGLATLVAAAFALLPTATSSAQTNERVQFITDVGGYGASGPGTVDLEGVLLRGEVVGTMSSACDNHPTPRPPGEDGWDHCWLDLTVPDRDGPGGSTSGLRLAGIDSTNDSEGERWHERYVVVEGSGRWADVTGGTAAWQYFDGEEEDLPNSTTTGMGSEGDEAGYLLTMDLVHDGAPASAPVASPDFNADACADEADLAAVTLAVHRAESGAGAPDLRFDLDGDDTLGQGDLDAFMTVYDPECQNTVPSSTSTSTSTASTSASTSTTSTTQTPTVPTVPDPPAPALPFLDIADDVHRPSIVLVAEEGIAAGFPDRTFRPGLAVTRGQMATFLARALDLRNGPTGPAFNDIAGDVHADAVRAIAREGITTGFGDGSFRPGLPVSREQMASFLTRAFDLPLAPPPFTDVSGVHTLATGAVARAGITEGFGDDTYRPTQPVTRGQMATFLGRALDL